MSKVEPLSTPSSRYQKMKINMFKITKFLYNNVTSYQLTEKRVCQLAPGLISRVGGGDKHTESALINSK